MVYTLCVGGFLLIDFFVFLVLAGVFLVAPAFFLAAAFPAKRAVEASTRSRT